MVRITKKAALGDQISPKKKASKDSVPSEMFPGKMIPKSKSNYATGKFAKAMEEAKKPVAPKKKMKDGGKAFPDLNKDGKVTKADILVGRGVIKANKGIKMKKAQDGAKTVKIGLRSGQLKRIGKLAAKNSNRAKKVAGRMVERATRKERGKSYLEKNISELMPKSNVGSKIKKARNGATLAPSKKSTSTNLASYKRVIGKSMRDGGSMKKCKYGCK